MSQVRNSSETVFMFDGIYMNIFGYPNRINARHERMTKTNLAFFDGHAGTYPTKDLPGGMYPVWVASPNGVFEINQLRNEPAGRPKWILEQQY